jgi:crossover junction endodeoxyribonuclease RusA
MLRITLDALPPAELSPNSRLHWTQQRKAKAKIADDVMILAMEAKQEDWDKYPLEKATVTFRFGLPDRRRRDPDNLLASCKTHLDALVGILLKDDSWKNVSLQVECFPSPKKPLTIIEVT